MTRRAAARFLAVSVVLLTLACAGTPTAQRVPAPVAPPALATDAALLDHVELRGLHYFWDLADPHTFLVPDRGDATETAIRAVAEELYERVDWPSEQARRAAISMGWTPEEGLHTYDWRGYNEAMIVILLALGSPTHPVDAGAWGEYTKTDRW